MTPAERDAKARETSMRVAEEMAAMRRERAAEFNRLDREEEREIFRVVGKTVGCAILAFAACGLVLAGAVYLIVLAVRLAWGAS